MKSFIIPRVGEFIRHQVNLPADCSQHSSLEIVRLFDEPSRKPLNRTVIVRHIATFVVGVLSGLSITLAR